MFAVKTLSKKLASNLLKPATTNNCGNTSCLSEALFLLTQLTEHFNILEVILHARAKTQSDEHIILRTSFLTMPIYFDNQLTIVPVQPLKAVWWFIRIDQFWVTSCAALWGQTEAWLAVQSGMLSNAQAWLTAHQHAELNSLAERIPFNPDVTHS